MWVPHGPSTGPAVYETYWRFARGVRTTPVRESHGVHVESWELFDQTISVQSCQAVRENSSSVNFYGRFTQPYGQEIVWVLKILWVHGWVWMRHYWVIMTDWLADGSTGGWMNGWTDGETLGRTSGCMYGWLDGWIGHLYSKALIIINKYDIMVTLTAGFMQKNKTFIIFDIT